MAGLFVSRNFSRKGAKGKNKGRKELVYFSPRAQRSNDAAVFICSRCYEFSFQTFTNPLRSWFFFFAPLREIRCSAALVSRNIGVIQ
jgi:hypothetical protein